MANSCTALVNDRRFEHFRPILDAYIKQHFSSSIAFSHIMKSLQLHIEGYAQPELAQDLRASIKVWQYLFKFIVASRKMQRVKEEHMNVTANHIERSFKRDLKQLLSAINTMMTAVTPPSVIGTQGRLAALPGNSAKLNNIRRSGRTVFRYCYTRVAGMFHCGGNDGICHGVLRCNHCYEGRYRWS